MTVRRRIAAAVLFGCYMAACAVCVRSFSLKQKQSTCSAVLSSHDVGSSSFHYDERRPRRSAPSFLTDSKDATSGTRRIPYERDAWGVQFLNDHHKNPQQNVPEFPSSIHALTSEIADTIEAVLSHTTKLDPNIVQNAVQGDSVHGRRPIRQAWDAGRMGIELGCGSSRNTNEGGMIRRISIELAAKLSTKMTSGISSDNSSNQQNRTKNPPVVVYLNTVKQALTASQQLLLLKRQQKHISQQRQSQDPLYENVKIRCLSDPVLPEELRNFAPDDDNDDAPNDRDKKKSKVRGSKTSRRRKQQQHSVHQPNHHHLGDQRGLVLIVQPTDYNDEYRPPGPAVCTVQALSQLVAQCGVYDIPVVCIAPRLMKQAQFHNDQSGYQQSSTYGGQEPPTGPTPWILRDFTPPVFSWIQESNNLALCQSVLHEGHAWHVFYRQHSSSEYQYLASTKNAAGRPTRELLEQLVTDYNKNDDEHDYDSSLRR